MAETERNDIVSEQILTVGVALSLLGMAIASSSKNRTKSIRHHVYTLCHDLYSVWLFAGFGWGCLITLFSLLLIMK